MRWSLKNENESMVESLVSDKVKEEICTTVHRPHFLAPTRVGRSDAKFRESSVIIVFETLSRRFPRSCDHLSIML